MLCAVNNEQATGADNPTALPPVRRVAAGTMLAYAFGAVAYGVKDSGFGTFLLLFYNQVIGLPAATVGLVVMCALLIDAVIDPAIGFFSDRTRGRWGRRHPWMYAAAVPIALGWLLLWNPPAWSAEWTLTWLFVAAVLTRSAVSCYEVPSVALTPELTADYDERTRIMAWRYLFGWAGGLTMLALAYLVFLAPTAEHPNGLLNRAGYLPLSITGAVLMAVAILVSAAGTHREIPRLPKPDMHTGGLRQSFGELAMTVKNRAFVILMLGGVCAYTNQGISYALSNYLYSYVWRFEGAIFFYLTITLMVGVVTAFLLGPRVAKMQGKPRTAAFAVLAGATFNLSPYVLRLFGVFPEPGDAALLPILFAFFVGATACNVSAFIVGASMMADVVEDSEVRTGLRSEGVFFAGSFFIQKCTSGLGIFLAGIVLALANFPERATPGQVPIESVDRLTMLFCLIYGVLTAVAATMFLRFPFGKAEHDVRVARMAAS